MTILKVNKNEPNDTITLQNTDTILERCKK